MGRRGAAAGRAPESPLLSREASLMPRVTYLRHPHGGCDLWGIFAPNDAPPGDAVGTLDAASGYKGAGLWISESVLAPGVLAARDGRCP